MDIIKKRSETELWNRNMILHIWNNGLLSDTERSIALIFLAKCDRMLSASEIRDFIKTHPFATSQSVVKLTEGWDSKYTVKY